MDVTLRFLIVLFVVFSISLALLNIVKAGKFGLAVQDTEINPAVAEIGEPVSVKTNLMNTERNNVNCKVTAFCGDCSMDTREIRVGGNSSVPLSFEVDTGCMASGVYSIEVLVETDSSQQQIFNLGSLTIEEASPTIDADNPIEIADPTIDRITSIEETEPRIDEVIPIEEASPTIDDPTIDVIGEAESPEYNFASTSSTSFSWQYLLPVVPAGAVSSIMVVMHKRKKSQDQGVPNEQMPKIFNEILKFEQQIENGTLPKDKKNYIA